MLRCAMGASAIRGHGIAFRLVNRLRLVVLLSSLDRSGNGRNVIDFVILQVDSMRLLMRAALTHLAPSVRATGAAHSSA